MDAHSQQDDGKTADDKEYALGHPARKNKIFNSLATVYQKYAPWITATQSNEKNAA